MIELFLLLYVAGGLFTIGRTLVELDRMETHPVSDHKALVMLLAFFFWPAILGMDSRLREYDDD